MSAVLKQKENTSSPFSFDLKKMQEAIAAPVYRLPNNLEFKEFQKWMKQQQAKKD